MEQPAWLEQAWRELGQQEIAGSRANARIVRLYRDAGHSVASDEVPWCAAFVGACLKRAGVAGTGSLMARSYARWGEPITQARLGSIAVLSRGRDPSLGHVGFVIGRAGGDVVLLGGNQGNTVSVARYPASRLVALRWPAQGLVKRPAVARPDAADAAASAEPGQLAARTKLGSAAEGDAFGWALAHVLEMEGGYSEDPHDPGGPTNKGILLREYARWKGETLTGLNQSRLKAELKAIPDATVRDIYWTKYWRPSGAAEMPPALALMQFDAAVNHGVGTAVRILQEAVGSDVDGEIGPLTQAAIAARPLAATLAAYAEIRRRRYRALPHFWRFGRGWLRRVEKTLARATQVIAVPDVSQTNSNQGDVQMSTQDVTASEGSAGIEGKWWGKSMTIWGILVTALSAMAPALGPAIGVDLPGEVVGEAGAQTVPAVQALGALVGAIVAIAGRLRASQPLQRRPLTLKV